MSNIGIIAGQGKLPVIWARAARARGHRVYAFPVREEKTGELADYAAGVYPISLGSLSRLIDLLQKKGITKVVMLGKVRKTHLFARPELDKRMHRLLNGLENLNDNTILLAITEELAAEGIEVLEQSLYLEDCLFPPGNITRCKPDNSLKADMEYGFAVAVEIARLDIGQTVVVKDRTVLAVEAAEGTDRAIRRGGKLGGSGVTVAKVSRPRQDFRFDIPTVGRETLRNLVEIEAGGLIIEANRTFLLDRDEFIMEADKAGIAVVARESEGG